MASLINRVEFNNAKSIIYQPKSFYTMKTTEPIVNHQSHLPNNNNNDSLFDEIESLQNQIRYVNFIITFHKFEYIAREMQEKQDILEAAKEGLVNQVSLVFTK